MIVMLYVAASNQDGRIDIGGVGEHAIVAQIDQLLDRVAALPVGAEDVAGVFLGRVGERIGEGPAAVLLGALATVHPTNALLVALSEVVPRLAVTLPPVPACWQTALTASGCSTRQMDSARPLRRMSER